MTVKYHNRFDALLKHLNWVECLNSQELFLVAGSIDGQLENKDDSKSISVSRFFKD